METRAHHLIVGFFVLGMLAVLAVFVIWLSRTQIVTQTQTYFIYFTRSVTGLQVGSPVRYQGVSVGRVTDVRIDPDNIGQVRVVIEVPKDTPITEGSLASLELQGITGFVYIQITSGTPGNGPIARGPEGVPVIPSKPSAVETVFNSAPEILERLLDLLTSAQDVFSGENKKNVELILKNAQETSAQLAVLSQKLQSVGDNANTTFNKASTLIDTLQAQAPPIAQNLQDLTASLRKSSDQISVLIRDNKDSVQTFTNTGLYEATLLMSDLRELVARLSRIAANIEKDPQGALFGPKNQGVKVK